MGRQVETAAADLDVKIVVLFALTVFLSAFLLFQVQPLISKWILPWFGGSPTVWTTAMLFFQSVLFGGYVYAHTITRRSPRVQAGVHIVLLIAAAVLAMWVVPGQSMKPAGDENPITKILLLLCLSVGLPYFCLATTGPLMQYWFSRARPGDSAYRLYALSNAGSFIALLSFPYVFEPLFELPQLGRFWTYGFWVFALLCAVVTLRVRHKPRQLPAEGDSAVTGTTEARDQPTLKQRISWVVLPGLASLTFIATTDHVSHNIAPEPRLWIATLSLYLLTFIICFDHPRWYRRNWVAFACVLTAVLLSGRNEIPGWFGQEWDYGVTEVRWSHLVTMFLVCFMCHGELYRRRPSNPRYLTEFYLWMSFGGACGGLFVALIATNFFVDYYEWPLCLVAAIALGCFIFASGWRAPGSTARQRNRSGGVAGRPQGNTTLAIALAVLVCLGLAGLVLYWEDSLHWRSDSTPEYTDIALHQSRNFYGTISVNERRYQHAPSGSYRVYYSGQVIHGVQYLDREKRRLPVGYYSEESGVGETLGYAKSRKPSLRVAVIGLGAGTLATYARAADRYDFYEINPEAVRVASQWFDNLSACLAQTRQVIIGDARLKLEQQPADVLYDVIALDAFTGDSVPIHLLTREAFQLYRRHLKPDGFIVVNITNSYLNLYPVVRRQAEALGMGFRNKYQPPEPDRLIRRNHYFVMTDDREYLQRFQSVNRKYFDEHGILARVEDPNLPDVPLWTDHFSSLNPIELPD
ncbi:fused MFS/spermidine synthase [Cupriavidus oxalaticus]|uniref:fused MFS/spermidine synthase n=1 Tax=Cupriavidus oxalaticus TaxID=96344 RepID=UPI003180D980